MTESKYTYRGRCISEALKKKYALNPKKKYNENRNCLFCGTQFSVGRRDSKKKFCDYNCFNEYSKIIKIRSGNGGKRNYAGRSIRGFFKRMYFSNTKELSFFIYHAFHSEMKLYKNRKSFKYFNENGISRRFRPCFVDDCGIYYEIIDTRIKSPEKYKSVINTGHQLILIDRKTVQPMIDWCKSKFDLKHISELFDIKTDLLFKYNCCWCKKDFISSEEKRGDYIFCNEQCKNTGIQRFVKSYNYTKPKRKKVECVEDFIPKIPWNDIS